MQSRDDDRDVGFVWTRRDPSCSCGRYGRADEFNVYSYRQPDLIKPLLDAFTKSTRTATNVLFLDKGLEERIAEEGENSPTDAILTVDIGRLQAAEGPWNSFACRPGLIFTGSAACIIYAVSIRFPAMAEGAIDSGFHKIPLHLDSAARALGRNARQTYDEYASRANVEDASVAAFLIMAAGIAPAALLSRLMDSGLGRDVPR